jgi:hypothetical protein
VGSNPINLGLRFILELAALAAMALWGWQLGAGVWRFGFAAAIPIAAAVLWGVAAVPDDPSRSGRSIFATPGIFRLAFEVIFFVVAVWALYATGYRTLAAVMAALVIIHYGLSWDRVVWLLSR